MPRIRNMKDLTLCKADRTDQLRSENPEGVGRLLETEKSLSVVGAAYRQYVVEPFGIISH